MEDRAEQIARRIACIPDYPEPGVLFRDITSLLADADGLTLAIDAMAAELEGVDFDVIAGLESRGFLFGMPLAYRLHKPFIPVRKKGKLPRATVGVSYDLEYGTAEIEVHRDDVCPGTRVVLVDDLIATGGTLEAAMRIFKELNAPVVKVICLLELAGLHGRERLQGCPVASIVAFEGK